MAKLMKLPKKITLLMAVLVAALMTISVFPVLAYQGVGGSPYAADLLVSGLNTGNLDPGREYWYAYSRLDLGDANYNSIILSLNFEAEGVAVANRVNFQVFTFEQVDAWLKDNSGPVDSLGLGTPASADFDANTGERLWSGAVAPTEVYYVRIFNLSPSPVQFRVTALGQNNQAFDGFMAVDPSAQNSAPGVIPASVSVPGDAPGAPAMETVQSPAPAKSSITALLPADPSDGSPASTSWLLAAQAINGLSPQEAAAWLMSAAMIGWLPGGENAASIPTVPALAPAVAPPPVPVQPDASLLTATEPDEGGQPDEVAAIPVEPKPEPLPNPNLGESIYPNRPLRLLGGPNTGRLGPKTEHWYTFTPGKFDDGKMIENYSLTMFFTPGEPNLARHVTFEVFTGDQYPIWSRGTPDDMEHFGAGSWVSRDGDYITGERLWHGTIVDGDQYYVKIANDTGKWVDYHLVPGDITNTELGKPVKAVVKESVPVIPTGKDIGAPLVVAKGGTSGKLASGEDIWFSFRTPNTHADSFEFLPYLFELTHKPGHGSVAHYVNVEIYPFQEQQIWRRGDGNEMKPLGVGSFTRHNKVNDTHTWVWDGHLVSNTEYFVRVRNDSPQEIDYDLLIRRR